MWPVGHTVLLYSFFSACPCQLDILLAKIQPPVQEENSKVYSLGTLLLYRDAYLSFLVLDQLLCMLCNFIHRVIC